jgi:Mg-chelatase subunit ChlD
MEVAKNQLARSVDQLDPKVRFNIVFYSNDVRVWKPAPELVPSSKAHKEDAKQWFLGLEPSGSTCMFAALLQALEYADTIGERTGTTGAGADTIFLISDGSPTSEAGELLTPAELERQYRSFMDRNALYHCVVHTIGIGPAHNSSVLERLARETGGQYKAVGAD